MTDMWGCGECFSEPFVVFIHIYLHSSLGYSSGTKQIKFSYQITSTRINVLQNIPRNPIFT
jgi:hypothetical protein